MHHPQLQDCCVENVNSMMEAACVLWREGMPQCLIALFSFFWEEVGARRRPAVQDALNSWHKRQPPCDNTPEHLLIIHFKEASEACDILSRRWEFHFDIKTRGFDSVTNADVNGVLQQPCVWATNRIILQDSLEHYSHSHHYFSLYLSSPSWHFQLEKGNRLPREEMFYYTFCDVLNLIWK